jgi:MFS family permease
VFGFHRAMDHAGAVTGPLLASAFLYFYPGEYRTLFALTIIPGIIVILIILRVPEPRRTPKHPAEPNPQHPAEPNPQHPAEPNPQNPVEPNPQNPAEPNPQNPAEPNPLELRRTMWNLGEPFYRATAIILLFSLGNASDAFLLLRLSDVGVATMWIPLLWSALHVVKVVSSLAGGALSDRFGRRGLIALGWLWYALVYAAFGVVDAKATLIVVFLSYGLYFGLTEGNEKAWVADMAPAGARGTAFGVYNAALGIGTLGASLIFGAIWTRISPHAAFLTGASLAVMASLLLFMAMPGATRGPQRSPSR